MNGATVFRGRALPLGDDVSTDLLHPPEFFSLDPEVVRRGFLAKYDPSIAEWIRPGDILVGGRNFGCGSSREAVVRCLALAGIQVIVAESFARIFFRTCMNLGIACLPLRDAVPFEPPVQRGEVLEVYPETHRLLRQSGEAYALEPLPRFIQELWLRGGIMSLLGEHTRPAR